MENTCLYCQKEFTTTRVPANFCNDGHRSAYSKVMKISKKELEADYAPEKVVEKVKDGYFDVNEKGNWIV